MSSRIDSRVRRIGAAAARALNASVRRNFPLLMTWKARLDDESALARANDSAYGLDAATRMRDLARVQRVPAGWRSG